MRLAQPLDDLLQNRSHVKVLRALTALPEGVESSIREIARRADISHPTAGNVLQSLERQGLVNARRSLFADEYRLNRRHELSGKLIRIFEWETALRDTLIGFLRDHLAKRAPWIEEAYLFGSAARGNMRPDSDLDVAVICDAGHASAVEDVLHDISELTAARFGNKIGYVIGTRPIDEITRSGQSGSRVWRAVQKEGIRFWPAEGEN